MQVSKLYHHYHYWYDDDYYWFTVSGIYRTVLRGKKSWNSSTLTFDLDLVPRSSTELTVHTAIPDVTSTQTMVESLKSP